MEQRIGYGILLCCIGVLIRAARMGTEKMIKLIIGNALIAGTCFALGNSIHLRATQLWATPDLSFLGISYERLAHLLQNGQLTFILLLFVGLVALVYTSSTIEVKSIQNSQVEKLYYILLIPLTLLSFIFALSIACMGEGMPAMTVIQASVSETFWIMGGFIDKMPIRMLIHGMVVLIISSHIKINFSLAKQSTIIPEGIDEL